MPWEYIFTGSIVNENFGDGKLYKIIYRGGLFVDYIVNAWELFHKGGFVMYILLLCSVFVVAIGMERGLYFHTADAGRRFAEEFSLLLGQCRLQEARRLLATAKGELPQLLQAAMGKRPAELAPYLEVQSGIFLSKLRKRLYYLSVIVTMAPLLGLLGTISGMISSFSVFNLESGQAAAITGGVGEALIATAMGLCVAIVSLTVHAYFSQRIENIITDMEQSFSLLEAQEKLLKECEEQVEGVACHEIA